MADETQDQTQETQIEEQAQTEEKTQEQEQAPPPEPTEEESAAAAPPPMPGWMKKRIDDTTAKMRQMERDKLAAEEKLRLILEANGGGEEPKAPKTELTEADLNRKAEEIASNKVAALEFNKACNAIAKAGSDAHKDFSESLKNFDMLGGLTPQLVQAAMETDSPQDVLYALSKDLERAEEIFSMSPLKQVAAMIKLEAGLKKPPAGKKISGAPEPITPKNGNGNGTTPKVVDLYDDSTSSEDWFAARKAQLRARRG